LRRSRSGQKQTPKRRLVPDRADRLPSRSHDAHEENKPSCPSCLRDLLCPPMNPVTLVDLRASFEEELRAAIAAGNVQPVRDRYLGRKDGVVTRLLKDVASAPQEERRERGAAANDFKKYVEEHVAEAAEVVREAAQRALSQRERVDVTLPGRLPALGHRHPLTLVRDRMEAIFTRMGFAIVEGPEVEDEWHCFDALNMPAEHPARDMQDTLYLAAPMPGSGGPTDLRTVLRTHTSSIQIRYMQAHEPPIRLVPPGRRY